MVKNILFLIYIVLVLFFLVVIGFWMQEQVHLFYRNGGRLFGSLL